MAIKLAEGEKIIEEYNYAHGKLVGIGKVDSSFIITNKRLITSVEGKHYLKRREIPIMGIKSVNGEFRKNSAILPILTLIIGVPLCIVGIGIPLVISAVRKLRACYVNLDFEFYEFYPQYYGTKGYNVGAFGDRDYFAPTRRRIFGIKKRNKIAVDKVMGKQLVDEIPAVIMDTIAKYSIDVKANVRGTTEESGKIVD